MEGLSLKGLVNNMAKMDLMMLTQEEVAEYLHSHISTVTMLREIGILKAIKTGRNYMIPQDVIKEFQSSYLGLDVSNKVCALKSKEIVERRLHEEGVVYNGNQS